ncbi:cytoplasmic dynein 2 intermediate chain 1 isoform X1 [Manduca sexta]|uniref:cytoplasmic dynein 2 intermediate chain 1 isoform X1 n=1 Tax=Manduca sexta TaxID=7130 RepID=UPI00188DC8A6|nr:cytoplasmic dynein 2 intermediate chain 1 isoform X1 [Manduca sexta]
MQTLKKTSEKSRKEKSRDAEISTKNSQDEKLKKISHNVTTPRSYMQKSSTADIYGQRNKNVVSGAKAPKKLVNASYKSSDGSPMRDLLKSSSSSVSVASRSDARLKKVEAKATPRKPTKVEAKATPRLTTKVEAKATPRTTRETPRRNLPFSNVTVSSPIVKRKLNLEDEPPSPKVSIKKVEREKPNRSISEALDKIKSKQSAQKNVDLVFERQRTKTRTLEEDEVKMLTPDAVDNNEGMMNLSRKLTAQPKAFFVDLEEGEKKNKNNVPSEEEVSYEDDFESYESDFESYHSESIDDKSSHGTESSEQNVESDDHEEAHNDAHIDSVKEVRDEERMLDSGSYDLRDRSAKSKPPIMENIMEDEDTEDGGNKKVSLPDEGFQEMSSSSAVSSLKTVHVDVLERPLFIDFKKSKEAKRKRRIFERLKKRAEDLLGMISLHEMTYSLFEMKPISYDSFMIAFGRENYLQTGVQTFDDGIAEEVQTDEIMRVHKWTQNPVKFSNSDVYLNYERKERKYSVVTVDYLTKFSFLTQKHEKPDIDNEVQNNENYKRNPLRIYLEQRDGVGSSEMLSYEKYKAAIKNKQYDSYKLGRFLKKIESRVSNMLSLNTSKADLDLIKTKLPFSKGYTSLNIKSISDENYVFLKQTTISLLFFSESKTNLIMTVHKQNSINKCLMCLWDASVVRREPTKMLISVDSVVIGRFRGSTEGIVVAGLKDGTIHLWDMSEEPSYIPNTNEEAESNKLTDVNLENLTEIEKDREWNLKNSDVKNEQQFDILHCPLQACAYTSSAQVMSTGEVSDKIVGLEFTSPKSITLDGKRRIVGQVVSLQSTGVLMMWTIVQEKTSTNTDLGKAYWSKMKLEKSQTIHLNEHIDNSFADNRAKMECFSLNSAKKRLMNKKYEKSVSKNARQKSAAINFGVGRSSRATSARNRIDNKMLPVQNVFNSGLICNDLKIMTVEEVENILVAKNCGEVLCCKRYFGVFKVQRFSVANEVSSVTSLQVSPHGLPHFLAATDVGAVNLCSLLEKKVLHTLDCRNVPPARETTEKYHLDVKGRFVGSVSVSSETQTMETKGASKMFVTSLLWSHVNPCCIYAVLRDGVIVSWDLSQSDIYGRTGGERARVVAAGDNVMAILTSDDEVQIHRFTDERRSKENLELFRKYIKLL